MSQFCLVNSMQLSTRELTDTILVFSMENASLKNKVKDLESDLDDARHQIELLRTTDRG